MVLLRIRINPIFLCNLRVAKSSDLLYDCRLILPNERMQKRGTERAWRATAIHVSDFIVAALNDQMQWAGTHYLISRMEDEHTDELTQGACYDTETLYWTGYLYRYWHIYNSDSSREILKQASAKTMRIVYLMYHTMSPEMAIDRLKEAYLEKRKNSAPFLHPFIL